jgi:hypothetical protein
MRKVLSQTRNEAMPVIDRHGFIQEYDHVFFEDLGYNISEDAVDIGHRHYSAMQWLYPGYFQPRQKSDTSSGAASAWSQAATRFMARKAANNGGHTSWSAAWEANIFARLGDGDGSLKSMERMLKKFSAANMLSLHPALVGKPAGKNVGEASNSDAPISFDNECDTCFEESPVSVTRSSAATTPAQSNRGMITAADDKFQIDGNLGFVAAVNEVLVQSHIRGHLSLLPALPHSLFLAGRISLSARGNVRVQLTWKEGHVAATTIQFQSNHPWLHYEPVDGEFVSSVGYYVASPNVLQMLPSSCASVGEAGLTADRAWHLGQHVIMISVANFPCTVCLYGSQFGKLECIH